MTSSIRNADSAKPPPIQHDNADRFRFLAETLPQKIFTARPNGDVEYVNQQWLEFTGLSFEQIQGWGWTQFVHAEEVEENLRRWRHSLATLEPFQFEHRLRRADGVYRWHLSRARPLRDRTGNVLSWVGSSTDIHDLKCAEESLREADRSKNEFLAMLAHELRNPLASIRNSVQVVRLKNTQDEDLQWATEAVERQLEQMTHLVDDLLDVARITRGKITLHLVPVELAEVVTQAVETNRPLIEARRHRLTLSLPDPTLRVEADPIRLTQVLSNLLNNAAKYTDEEGQLSLSVERPSVGEKLQDEVLIRVRDTGMGIAPEMLPKIFDLFTQANRTLDRSQGGLGIGLTLVRRLVEMHGGTVRAYSAGPGRGSEFVVRLPLLKTTLAAPAPSPPPDPEPDQKLHSRRILVVDDNRDAARSLSMLLRLVGHEVQVAHDGPSALTMARSYPFEVVLLDIGLPDMDGLEVARRLRQELGLHRLLVVALTGYGQDDDRRRSQEAGFNAHLVKPVELKALHGLLARPFSERVVRPQGSTTGQVP